MKQHEEREEVKNLEIHITLLGSPKEIAALALELRERQGDLPNRDVSAQSVAAAVIQRLQDRESQAQVQ